MDLPPCKKSGTFKFLTPAGIAGRDSAGKWQGSVQCRERRVRFGVTRHLAHNPFELHVGNGTTVYTLPGFHEACGRLVV
eukprot:554716-Amphidinium_carterae.1